MPDEQATNGQAQAIDYNKIDWSAVPVQVDDISEEQFKQVGDVKLIRRDFESVPGAAFWVPEYLSVAALAQKYDEKTVLNLVNSAINNGLRIKARGKLPSFEDPEEQRKQLERIKAHGEIILTEVDAMAYVPGERELSAAGYQRLANKALAQGDKALARSYVAKAIAANNRLLATLGEE